MPMVVKFLGTNRIRIPPRLATTPELATYEVASLFLRMVTTVFWGHPELNLSKEENQLSVDISIVLLEHV